ncbi:polysaccharide deacetylase family protein [Ramlibacter tataouinensis]|uniref:polysaccharide deacetylase family protein n=1 Tax=Ramlibacter tataouinensis TaxID=94132 RepID=UPI0022F3F31C|nr:polysaccharide deacetylase family protein [Ramlibacter tataouinensis]WBY03019.1 polysaccharide deacetylase family protein [Ramlibacter tataouinensis]
MHPRDRIEYSSPFHRPPLRIADGTRLIIWPVVNVEEWEIERPMPRHASPPPGGVTGAVPDMPNWTWHEYGMRVGFWRLLEAFDKRGIRPTMSINAKVCETSPRVAEAARDAGWEFMAHCYVQMPIHKIEDQPAMIGQSLDTLERFLGHRPRGWLGPGRTQTLDTLEHVAASGLDWFGDWILDDQPLWVKTATRPLVSIPYTVEINDITVMVSGQHESDALLRRARDAFERLYAEGEESVRIMAFGVHPYVTGAAHRIRYFEEMLDLFAGREGVQFWNGDQIHGWFVEQRPHPDRQPA